MRDNDREIILGVSKVGNVISIPAMVAPRLAVMGSSRSGKSNLVGNNLLPQYFQKLRNRVVVHALDPKRVSLAHLRSRLDDYVTEPSEFLPTLQAFETTMAQRYADMDGMGVSKLGEDYLDEYPMHILLLEEANSILGGGNEGVNPDAVKRMKSLMGVILTQCAAANMGVIVCAHNFQVQELMPSTAVAQMPTRVIFQTSSKKIVESLAEPELAPAHLISRPGEFYFSAGEGAVWVRGKTWLTSDGDARAVAEAYSIDRHDNGLSWVVEKPE